MLNTVYWANEFIDLDVYGECDFKNLIKDLVSCLVMSIDNDTDFDSTLAALQKVTDYLIQNQTPDSQSISLINNTPI